MTIEPKVVVALVWGSSSAHGRVRARVVAAGSGAPNHPSLASRTMGVQRGWPFPRPASGSWSSRTVLEDEVARRRMSGEDGETWG